MKPAVYEIQQPLKSKFPKDCVGAYAVQCEKCFKWRLIPSLEEYETIRETFIEEPWYCERRPDITCDHPGDIEYDATRLWIIDKPNLPKPPRGTKRGLSLRRDLSKLDVHYVMPGGKKVRSSGEVEKFLDAHPEYEGKLSVSSFAFTPPKILEDMVPRNPEGKTPKYKRLKGVSDEDS
ncbi:Methyl-CpG-binding domain-containing protein 4 [Platanthera zijinensis]|uniref:Methyl-CpG-binding domain-containing protein 4 n=1 Tax=Platanthera zijinensis TaxID=2320716 RepID=A0AAP0BYR3_9ASPA